MDPRAGEVPQVAAPPDEDHPETSVVPLLITAPLAEDRLVLQGVVEVPLETSGVHPVLMDHLMVVTEAHPATAEGPETVGPAEMGRGAEDQTLAGNLASEKDRKIYSYSYY